MTGVSTFNRAEIIRRIREGLSIVSVRLLDAAVDMMHGDKDAATTWLRSPLEILGGESPIAHAETELGARDVEDLIGRIKYGVFS